MAVLIVDDVASADDVLNLARHLLDALANDAIEGLIAPGTVHLSRGPRPISDEEVAGLVDMDGDYACDRPHHRPGCTCRQDAAVTDPRQLAGLDAARHDGPVPYVPCPRVGNHARLTECWMCWSDVHRGALPRELALAQV